MLQNSTLLEKKINTLVLQGTTGNVFFCGISTCTLTLAKSLFKFKNLVSQSIHDTLYQSLIILYCVGITPQKYTKIVISICITMPSIKACYGSMLTYHANLPNLFHYKVKHNVEKNRTNQA